MQSSSSNADERGSSGLGFCQGAFFLPAEVIVLLAFAVPFLALSNSETSRNSRVVDFKSTKLVLGFHLLSLTLYDKT